VSAPWWATRDPDLGLERGSKHLGQRDWSWFQAYAGSSFSPSDVEAADIPWAEHPTLPTDRHDRTRGIPRRETSMWPHRRSAGPAAGELALIETHPTRRQQLASILSEVHAIPAHSGPPNVSPALLAEVLGELAPTVYGRSPNRQYTEISTLARQQGIPTDTLMVLARKAGNMIAQTSQQPAPAAPGEPNLNRLLSADLTAVSELLLARMTLATARAYSDPDLPRLWILANALHNTVPASIFTTQPARSYGPDAIIIPTHDDLVGWHGVRAAVEQLQATVDAAQEGRRWINGLDMRKVTAEQRILALGVLQLTHPRTAYELLLLGQSNLTTETLYQIGNTPAPLHIADLSDAALKAMCDRNGWLLGTAEERAQRELVERHLDTAMTDDIRTQLANGDTRPLTEALTLHSPTNEHLDRATWRYDPSADAQQRHQLLDLASCEAVCQFTGYEIKPHPSKSAAFAARFPNRLSEQGLRVGREALLADPAPPGLTPGPDPSAAAQLDLGL
jgi:hypothetical protein